MKYQVRTVVGNFPTTLIVIEFETPGAAQNYCQRLNARDFKYCVTNSLGMRL